MWVVNFLACVVIAATPQSVDHAAPYLRLVSQFDRSSATRVASELASWEPKAVEAALESLEKSDRITPRVMLLELYTALLALQQGRREIADNHLELVLKLSHNTKRAQNDRAFYEPFYLLTSGVLQRQWDLPAAASLLTAAQEAFPENVDALVTLGAISEAAASGSGQTASRGERWPDWLRDRRTNLTRAADIYTKVLEKDKANTEATVRLANVLYAQGQREQAAATLERVAGPAKDTFMLYMSALLLGRLAQDAGDHARAVEQYRRATELFPRSQTAFIALSHALMLLGRADEATPTVEQMLEPSTSKSDVDDPWWEYQFGQTRHYAALMEQLWVTAIK